jgi:hypothetical protein
MVSIFSNYLSPLNGECAQELKPSKVYTQLRIAYNQGVTGILNSTRIISVGNDDDDYDIICESFRNEDFKTWIQWVNKKITLELGNVDYRTIDVRLRIAVNMLNTITWNYPRFKKIAFKVHLNLIDNVRREMSAINTEDLPF